MFTGIIECIGEISAMTKKGGGYLLTITSPLPLNEVALGDSIAVNGMCLTVTSLDSEAGSFTVDAVDETADVTTIGEWRAGTRVNLERALAFGGRLDGHLVSGHVDGTGRVSRIARRGAQMTLSVTMPKNMAKWVVPKGSITIDGVSLTVAAIAGSRLDVAVIPFTWEHTTLHTLLTGHRVNLEGDLIGKHIANLINYRQ